MIFLVANRKFLFPSLLLFVLLLISNVASAQILNIERHRMAKDSTKNFFANGKFGLASNNRSAAEESPVNLFGVNTALNMLYRSKQHAYIFVGQTDYLRINENTFLNFGFAHFRVNFLHERKFHYELFTQASYDNFRGLDPRLIFGGSLRLRAIEGDKGNLTVGLGGFYEKERWTHPQTDELVEVNFAKLSTYISVRRTLAERVDFNAVVYYQTGYDPDISDFRHRVSSNINLNTQITERLSFNNSFEMSYEDKPIVPITRFIYALRMGLLISI